MLGIFDSGLGGLTITKEIFVTLPEYQVIYFGDTAHVPYGNRSQEEIYKLTQNAIDFLFSHGAELIIVACNTASSKALRKIQQEYLPVKYPDKRVLGVIRPVVEKAITLTKNNKIGVVGTRGTIESGAFERELKTLNPEIKVVQRACPLLVPLIEESWAKRPETIMILKKYLRPIKDEQVDTLILGCTHYPMLYKNFVQVMGQKCQVLDSGKIVAESLKDYLKRHPEIEVKLKKGDKHQFFVSDITDNFRQSACKFLNKKIILKYK
ncbi:MAG: glutamate racemase [Patescibacteria group bacterium]